VLWVKQRYFSL